MRMVGIYRKGGVQVNELLDQLVGAQEHRANWHLKVLVYPVQNPIIAAVVNENAQPPVSWATSHDGSFVILDGEVYNVDQAKGDANPGTNQAGRILDLYFSDRQRAIARLDGAATIVIWDAAQQLLHVFRDQDGIVPSFYCERHDGLAWAADVGTLLRTGASDAINLPALDFFLGNGFVPAPWTLVDSVKKIPPAHVVRCAAGGPVTLHRYWRPSGSPQIRLGTDETIQRLSMLFERSLRRRWPTDGKAGVLLSGGVDSMLILAGLVKLVGVSPETFTFRYANYEGRFNESDPACEASAHFGARHHEIVFGPADIVDNLERMVCSYGEPFTYGLHSSLLGDVKQRGIHYLLNGAGADGWYLSETNVWGLRYAQLPSIAQNLGVACVPVLRRLNSTARPLWLWRLYEAAGDLADQLEAVLWCAESGLPWRCGSSIVPYNLRVQLYSYAGWVPASCDTAKNLFTSAAADYVRESRRNTITFLQRQFFNAEGTLYWNHRWSRAHGLTIRFPFFDRELCEFAMRLRRRSQNKAEIRQLAATLMPRGLAYAPKVPQTVPIGHWFRGPLKDFLKEQLSSPRIKDSGLFNSTVVQRLLKEHINRENGHEWKLWAILTVLVWQDLVRKRRL